MGLLHHPFWLQLRLAFSEHQFQLFNYFVWPRITDDGTIPELHIWSIFLIKSDLKWCIHLQVSRILFLYFNYFVSHCWYTPSWSWTFTIKQPTNKLKIRTLSETSILYFIRPASFIMTVGPRLWICICQQANIVGRKILAHSGLEPATEQA